MTFAAFMAGVVIKSQKEGKNVVRCHKCVDGKRRYLDHCALKICFRDFFLSRQCLALDESKTFCSIVEQIPLFSQFLPHWMTTPSLSEREFPLMTTRNASAASFYEMISWCRLETLFLSVFRNTSTDKDKFFAFR